jgi:crotonobetainyl-CoA:carnitine CoA-transferase CaiB-like acyl-CoA transferase
MIALGHFASFQSMVSLGLSGESAIFDAVSPGIGIDQRRCILEATLSGTRILDFTRAVAGPYGSLLLADLGAEVIKIEQVPSEIYAKADALDADWAALMGYPVSEKGRGTPEGERRWRQGRSHFQSLNRNKKRLALNLKTEKGKEIFYELVRKSDVVYDNYRPPVAKNLGIDFDTLRQINPEVVSVSVSGFGATGPWSDAPAYDVILQGLAGIMSMTGIPGMPPCRCGIAIADLCGGMFAALGILVALRARDQTGLGQRVDLSMLDGQISLLNYRVGQYSAVGTIGGPVGSGHSGAGQIPYGAYECRDGTYIVLAAGSPRHWGKFIRALGLPELEHDPSFNTNANRQRNIEAITGIIEGMLMTKTAEEWEKIFFDVGIPVGKVNNIAQALSHPQVLARNMVVAMEQPEDGDIWRFAGNPIKIMGTPEKFEAARGIGADTRGILSSILGYEQKYINQLKEMAICYCET